MANRTQTLLSYCSRMAFGHVRAENDQKAFCNELNTEIISLCKSMPVSTQNDAFLFILINFRCSIYNKFDFFKYYYAPAWSIIYWLIKSVPKEKDLTEEDIRNAKTAHSMAMLLHPLDDHLNDSEWPATHLTVLLRSQAWLIMINALERLTDEIENGDKTVRDFIDRYYSSVCGSETIGSLHSYCDRFKKQMATWLITPALLTQKIGAADGSAEAILSGYESFGVAWRLLDDVNDLSADIKKGVHSAFYSMLSEDRKEMWDKNAALCDDKGHKCILDYICQIKAVDFIRDKICKELESAAVAAAGGPLVMTGLANEYRCLMEPFKNP